MSEQQTFHDVRHDETLIVYHIRCKHPGMCGHPDTEWHERRHIDGYCSEARDDGDGRPLPDHEVRYGDWTESNCTPCHIAYRVVHFGETVEPAHKPGGVS